MENGLKQQRISHLPAQDECTMEMGSQKYGCSHYRRRCKIIAPCCNEIFDCRHCHNDAKNSIEVDPLDRHDIPRHELKRVICSMCKTEQDVQQMCINCGVCLGKYYCSKCKFFDDDVSKNQYHCEKWNMQYLFDTPRDTTVLPCGHTIHLNCVKEMERHFQYSCPVCSKSYCDMSRVWERLDQEVASIPMPQMYQNKMVWILCNDCGERSEVNYHILAHKCLNCKSYNTRQTRGGGGGHTSCSNRILEMVR
ncbi:UNVERIFIED_CONTAM: E3 ubiquitin-protein ligase RZFP34 [Sesamum calycinum]|uniref:E3 ubiquitin-protein ligase RZFP34 n=1 Tax=Sesamum calycinum TaxID=2727403 RepID=A0AAW2NU97_9LAMI